jgi:hypothetical protein
MTRGGDRTSFEALGAPVPGVLWLPDLAVKLESRAGNDALVWKADNSSPPKTSTIAREVGFVSVPWEVPETTIKRWEKPLTQRSAPRDDQDASLQKLIAAFQLAGGQVQYLRQIPPGAPPLFGGAGVLDDFIKLSELSTAAILAFVAHWGPIGICEHLVPYTHSLSRRSVLSVENVCLPLGVAASEGRAGWEPVDKWREYSKDAASIVSSAIKFKNSRKRSLEEIQQLFSRVAGWLDLAAAPLAGYAEFDAAAPWPCGFTATLGITNVFQIVALQLLALASGGRELAFCSHCGQPFVLSGYRPGKRRFCQPCITKKVPARYASRDYRRTRRTPNGDA